MARFEAINHWGRQPKYQFWITSKSSAYFRRNIGFRENLRPQDQRVLTGFFYGDDPPFQEIQRHCALGCVLPLVNHPSDIPTGNRVVFMPEHTDAVPDNILLLTKMPKGRINLRHGMDQYTTHPSHPSSYEFWRSMTPLTFDPIIGETFETAAFQAYELHPEIIKHRVRPAQPLFLYAPMQSGRVARLHPEQ